MSPKSKNRWDYMTQCGSCKVSILKREDGTPEQIMIKLGKAGTCGMTQTDAIERLINLLLDNNVNPLSIIKQLKGIKCSGSSDEAPPYSCSHAIALALENIVLIQNEGGKK